jgi:hypothetical protein
MPTSSMLSTVVRIWRTFIQWKTSEAPDVSPTAKARLAAMTARSVSLMIVIRAVRRGDMMVSDPLRKDSVRRPCP